MAESDLARYEWVEDGKPYREWLIPARIVNGGKVRRLPVERSDLIRDLNPLPPPFSPIVPSSTAGLRRRQKVPIKIESDAQPSKSPIQIENRGLYKIAVSDEGYGSNATATFIREHTIPLEREIERARTIWIAAREKGHDPTIEIAKSQSFPEINSLCADEDIKTFLIDGKTRTAKTAASDIMQKLFPRYELKSVQRMGRAQKRNSKQSKPKG
jgi:hypothetical protein